MKRFVVTMALVPMLLCGTTAVAQDYFSLPRYQKLYCDLFISAFKKQVALTEKGGNETLAKCPGYEQHDGKSNNFKDTGNLFKALRKAPREVKKAGKGAKGTWQVLLLEGTPRDVALDLLDEPEFWAVVEEYDKPRKQ